MRRFYAGPGVLDGSDSVRIAPPLSRRLAKVLRMRTGDQFALFDGGGTDLRVAIEAIAEREIVARVVERTESPAEPRVAVHLYQSITKGERFEWLLEKGTEIGVARFAPLITARAVVKTEAGGNKAERWRRIVVEAAEQCGRGAVPAVEAPISFEDAIATAPGVLLLPYERASVTGEDAMNIDEALRREIDAVVALQAVSVLIGPEGGYEEAEVERAREAGATIVSMGERVFRSETAGLVAATLVMQSTGELG